MQVRPIDVRGFFRPDVALLELAAAALGLACRPVSQRLGYEGLADRYLADLMLDGRTVCHRTQFAVSAAACLRRGPHPELPVEADGWEPRLWTYGVSAVVYCRARRGRPRPADGGDRPACR
ncbi:hypothetical protein [Blastococcus sp. TF02A-26]|uniref:hypothetical protein n=1 Tax=Blastococcus sp. TF02A-26 TaxID=2250577 RepID=UPI000DEA98C9|nr:hypothetical protein [Blastococcus sp. TF02A-26]RBY83112.1 hypothetical protein DQ240_17000 [Blastococcus sp. TF02A-26]